MSEPRARRERSRKLCRILAAKVREATTDGLGRWAPCWELVRAPSQAFLDALARWERTGDERHMNVAKERALDVLRAWEAADQKYRKSARAEPHPVP